MKTFRRWLLAVSLLLLTGALALPSATFAQPPNFNPDAHISWPPPIYVVRGVFEVRGTAALPNMQNYFIEFRQINEYTLQPASPNAPWFPATLPSTRPVRDGVLGLWDTTLAENGAYELRLTVNVRQSRAIQVVVSPLRVDNDLEGGIPVPTSFPTFTPRPFVTPTPIPTQYDPTPRGIVTANPSGNVRTGDSTQYPVLTSLRNGTEVLLVGISSRGTGWYQVRIPDGRFGWMSFSVLQVSGDLNRLPFVQPPPLPTATPTPTQPNLPNLVAVSLFVNPNPPICNQTFIISLDITNNGTLPTPFGGNVTFADVRAADGITQQSAVGTFPVLAPGQTFRVTVNMTVSTWFNETHRIIATIDSANTIQEITKNDNVRTLDYVLQPGTCAGGGGGSLPNLVAGNLRVDPFPPTCNQQFTVNFDVANLGGSTVNNGSVIIQDTRLADGTVQGTSTANFGAIAPGQTVTVSVNFTISTWFNETHRIVAIIDPNNNIAETNEGDNINTVDYVLQQGGCA